MRILITGGGGFLGNALVEHLSKNRSNQIYILDSYIHGSSLINKLPKRKNVHPPVIGNIRNYYDIFRVIDRDKPDVIVHLAAFITRPESVDNFRTCSEVNYVGMANMLDACSVVKNKPSKIVFASCEAARDPVSHYGISKRASEDLLHLVAPLMQIDPVSLRLSEIYGLSKSFTSNSMINFLTDAMILNKDIALFNVNKRRDFVHVGDAVIAFEKAIGYEEKFSLGKLDIGTGIPLSIKDLVFKLKQVTSYKGNLIFRESENIKISDSWADTLPAKNLLNFETQADLDTELVKMYKARKKALK